MNYEDVKFNFNVDYDKVIENFSKDIEDNRMWFEAFDFSIKLKDRELIQAKWNARKLERSLNKKDNITTRNKI